MPVPKSQRGPLHSSARSLEREGIPRRFTTAAKTVIISNDWKTLNRNVSALQDRGFVLLFEPTAEEVHREAGRWFSDSAIYRWFGENLHRVREPSLRHYQRASMLKAAGMDFSVALPLVVANAREQLVRDLLGDDTLTQEGRVRQFIAQGGGCRRTFFYYRKRIADRSPRLVQV